jgi:hypothetical protein
MIRLLVTCAVLGLACAPAVWDVEGLAERHPTVDVSALGAATPYVLPLQGSMLLFLCRWPGPLIPVSLPADASPEELDILWRVMAAWENAGLGVRFVRSLRGKAISIRFVESRPGVETRRTAATAADCRVKDPDPEAPVLSARITSAAIVLLRAERNAVGREVARRPEELAGSVLHELGHALGFQGHTERGNSIMNRSVDTVRDAGRKLLEAGTLEAPELRALYALPTGVVVGRYAVSEEQTSPVDRLLAIGRLGAWRGPFVRVGDRAGRLTWRDGRGDSYVLRIPKIGEALRDPSQLRVVPVGAAAGLVSSPSP